jgi:hypothetical protein
MVQAVGQSAQLPTLTWFAHVACRPMIQTVKNKIVEVATQIQKSDAYDLRVGFVAYR